MGIVCYLNLSSISCHCELYVGNYSRLDWYLRKILLI